MPTHRLLAGELLPKQSLYLAQENKEPKGRKTLQPPRSRVLARLATGERHNMQTPLLPA